MAGPGTEAAETVSLCQPIPTYIHVHDLYSVHCSVQYMDDRKNYDCVLVGLFWKTRPVGFLKLQ